MMSIDEILKDSQHEDVITFADHWIKEHGAGNVTGEYHMNLLAWHRTYPAQALAITIALVNKVDCDMLEDVAISVVKRMFEWAPDTFLPILCDAIDRMPILEICTRGERRAGRSARWQALSGAKAGQAGSLIKE